MSQQRDPCGGSLLCGVEQIPRRNGPIFDGEVVGLATHDGGVFGKITCLAPETLCHQRRGTCPAQNFTPDGSIVALNQGRDGLTGARPASNGSALCGRNNQHVRSQAPDLVKDLSGATRSIVDGAHYSGYSKCGAQ